MTQLVKHLPLTLGSWDQALCRGPVLSGELVSPSAPPPCLCVLGACALTISITHSKSL